MTRGPRPRIVATFIAPGPPILTGGMHVLYAMTVLGFTFSGREAALIALVVVVLVAIAWWLTRRRR